MKKLLILALIIGLCGVSGATDLSSIYSNIPLNKLTGDLDTNGYDVDGSTTNGYLILKGDSGATDDFKLYDSGIIDMPKQSGCSVYLGTAQSIADATATKLQLDTELFDNQSEYDAATNYRFTATKAGIYSINGCVRFDQNADQDHLFVNIYKNGAALRYFDQFASGADKWGMSFSEDVKLAANDYVEIYILHFAGVAITVSSSELYTRLNITKLN